MHKSNIKLNWTCSALPCIRVLDFSYCNTSCISIYRNFESSMDHFWLLLFEICATYINYHSVITQHVFLTVAITVLVPSSPVEHPSTSYILLYYYKLCMFYCSNEVFVLSSVVTDLMQPMVFICPHGIF